MSYGSVVFAVALAPLIVPFLAGEASALNARTWISGKGTDTAGCGPLATPCRTLQHAHDVTAPGGEIDVLDPAGYGSVVITKTINVINDGVGVAGVLASAGGVAITINAGSNDAIVLRGLTIEGANVGVNGIVFNSGGRLTVSNCLIQNFAGFSATGNGIFIQHTAGRPRILINDTTASNNAYVGIFNASELYADLSIDRVNASNNAYGIVAGDSSIGVISNSYVSNNTQAGIQLYRQTNGGARFLIDSVHVVNNARTNLEIIGGARFTVSRVITAGVGYDLTCDVKCYVDTYNNNRINDFSGPSELVAASYR